MGHGGLGEDVSLAGKEAGLTTGATEEAKSTMGAGGEKAEVSSIGPAAELTSEAVGVEVKGETVACAKEREESTRGPARAVESVGTDGVASDGEADNKVEDKCAPVTSPSPDGARMTVRPASTSLFSSPSEAITDVGVVDVAVVEVGVPLMIVTSLSDSNYRQRSTSLTLVLVFWKKTGWVPVPRSRSLSSPSCLPSCLASFRFWLQGTRPRVSERAPYSLQYWPRG